MGDREHIMLTFLLHYLVRYLFSVVHRSNGQRACAIATTVVVLGVGLDDFNARLFICSRAAPANQHCLSSDWRQTSRDHDIRRGRHTKTWRKTDDLLRSWFGGVSSVAICTGTATRWGRQVTVGIMPMIN
jgi:hypothetical protein